MIEIEVLSKNFLKDWVGGEVIKLKQLPDHFEKIYQFLTDKNYIFSIGDNQISEKAFGYRITEKGKKFVNS